MSEVDAILKELDALLTQAVGVADQTAAKLQRAAEEREIVAERGETHDLRDAAHRIRLQLRDAQGFLATRRAHAPLVDIETGELPNALANVRSLAANLADEQYDVDTSDRLEKTRATIDSLGQIVYHVDRCCGPHGSGSGPRGRPKWGVTIDDVSQLPNFGRTTPPRGLTDSES